MSMRGITSLILVFLLASFIVHPNITHGQSVDGLGINNTANLRLEPAWPTPNSLVTVSLNAYAFDLVGASIRWSVNGESNESGSDARSIEIELGELMSEVQVEAQITLRDNRIITARETIRPSEVDVIIEADTQTHPQYAGRALGSIGSPIRIVAIPHAKTNLSTEQLTYTWKLNNRTLFGGSARGRNAIAITMPAARESFLTVDVLDNSGITIAHRTIILSPHDVEIVVYENNPLRGLSQRSIGREYLQILPETSFQAIPYFANTDMSDFIHEWTINDNPVDNPSIDPRSLTIQRSFSGDSISLAFMTRNLKELLQGDETEFVVTFTP